MGVGDPIQAYVGSFFYVPMSPGVPEVRDLKHWGACTFEFLDVVFTFMPSESLL